MRPGHECGPWRAGWSRTWRCCGGSWAAPPCSPCSSRSSPSPSPSVSCGNLAFPTPRRLLRARRCRQRRARVSPSSPHPPHPPHAALSRSALAVRAGQEEQPQGRAAAGPLRRGEDAAFRSGERGGRGGLWYGGEGVAFSSVFNLLMKRLKGGAYRCKERWRASFVHHGVSKLI